MRPCVAVTWAASDSTDARSVTSAPTPSASSPSSRSARRGRRSRALVEVGEHDVGARLGERGSDSKADSAGAAGDDGDLLRE